MKSHDPLRVRCTRPQGVPSGDSGRMKVPARCVSLIAPFLLTGSALTQVPAIQANWVQSPTSGNWYGVDFSTGTWASRQAVAQSLGGNLATVRNQSEQIWCLAQFQPYMVSGANWIGLFQDLSDPNYSEPAGGWKWTSGEPLTYGDPAQADGAWNPGEPNNAGSGEHVAGMTLVGWNDGDGTNGVHRPLIELPTEPQMGWTWPREIAHDYSTHAVLFDLDGDGNLDAITSSSNYPAGGSGSVMVAWGDGAGGFAQTTQVDTGNYFNEMAIIDVDLDGNQDIVVCAATSTQRVYWMPNLGSRQFGVTGSLDSGTKFTSVGSCDLSGDGLPDLYATGAHIGDCLRVYVALPTGGFAGPQIYSFEGSYGGDPWPVGAEHGDIDGDGDVDLVVALSNAGAVVLMINDGTGALTDSGALTGGTYPSPFTLADLDGDGDLDLAVPYYGSDDIFIFANDGLGTFTVHSWLAVPGAPWYCEPLDFDSDGILDLAVSQRTSSSVTLCRNLGSANFLPLEFFSPGMSVGDLAVGQFDGVGGVDLLVTGQDGGRPQVWTNSRPGDCNGNGIPDDQDISSGSSNDCNGNGIPDECDIAADPSSDWDGDGVLDDCSSPNYCAANTNTTGQSAAMSVSGSPLLVDNAFTMTASQMPAFEWGYFLMSPNQGFIPNVGGSSGNLCLGSPFYRFNKVPTGQVLNSQVGGTFSFTTDLNNLPQGVVFQIGETWNFQAWFRDGFGNTSNFTDGIAVMFR